MTRPGLTMNAGLRPRKRSAYRRWSGSRSNVHWDQFVRARSQAEACYASANDRYSERGVVKLDASLSPGHSLRALEGPVLLSSSGIPLLQAPGNGIVYDPIGNAELLSSWFDRSSEVSRLLLVLDGSGSVDPSGFSPLFSGNCIGDSFNAESDV